METEDIKFVPHYDDVNGLDQEHELIESQLLYLMDPIGLEINDYQSLRKIW